MTTDLGSASLKGPEISFGTEMFMEQTLPLELIALMAEETLE